MVFIIPVMIVEDEFLVRLGLKTVINWEKEGFRIVAEAENGEDGIKNFKEFLPKVIFTDLKMPKMDGIEMMERIREMDKTVKFIVISAYNDFSYIQKVIKIGIEYYSIKGTLIHEEILEILNKIRSNYVEENNVALLQVQTNNEIEFSDILNIANCPNKIKEKLILSFNDLLNLRVLSFKTKNEEIAINNFFYEAIKSQNINFIEVTNSGNQKYYIVKISELQILELSNAIEKNFSRYVSLPFAFGFSQEIKSIENMRRYLLESSLASELAFYFSEVKYLVYSNEEVIDMREFDEYIKELRNNLITNSSEENDKILENIKILVIQGKSLKMLSKFIYELIGIISNYNSDKLELQTYNKYLNVIEIDNLFYQAKIELIEIKEKIIENAGNQNNYVERAKIYINNNINKNIKIKDIAEHLFLSPNYLGKIFLLETNMYLTDYINCEKLNIASKMLIVGGKSVNEIASSIGIYDQHYFSKIFKKRYGMSPKEYTSKHLME